MTMAQKYPDGDCRRRGPGYKPRTSNGRGHGGNIGASLRQASFWKDLDGAKVIGDVRPGARRGEMIAVDKDGGALFGSMALMALARFVRGRSGRGR